jgi:hypothetical protein
MQSCKRCTKYFYCDCERCIHIIILEMRDEIFKALKINEFCKFLNKILLKERN